MDQADFRAPRPGPAPGPETPTGRAALRRRRVVDFSLRRRGVLSELRDGRLSLREVCDADVYLQRAAGFHGVATETLCPVCRKENLTEVSWVFGDDLGPASGSARGEEEITQLALTHDAFTVHVVEVCRSCSWNHLVESYEVGLPEGSGRRVRRAARELRRRG
ncbi:MAG TPA: DUF5318 domain-containing protein [Actinomycetales bacterium]|nr:DUF5318 domain-containing protein [Actinomycetales bacterium]